MGYHIILQVTCELKPEFIPLIEERYLQEYLCQLKLDYPDIYVDSNDDPWASNPDKIGSVEVPDEYKTLLDTWRNLRIGPRFYKYELNENIFNLRMEKKPHRHPGYLHDDYMAFIMNILMPISTNITKCIISEDDWGCQESHYSWEYLEREYTKLKGQPYHSNSSNITYY